MYYYIFDIKKCKKKSQVENIKSHLSSLGIAGEYTYPSSANTVDELIEMGLKKEYTTIVGIGGDEIANAIANRLTGKKEAMGFIPIDPLSSVANVIGAKSWRDACEILRYRKLSEIRVGRTASDTCFITELKLALNSPIDITVEFKDFIAQAKVTSFTVSNFNPDIKKLGNDYLDIIFHSVEPSSGSIMNRLFGSMKQIDTSKSLIRARSLRIFTKNQLPLYCGTDLVAKTPQLIESSDDNLRLITAKNAPIFWEE